MNTQVVKVFKYDGKLHYEWESEVVEDIKEYILLRSYPGRKLIHHTRNKVFNFDSYSLEFFPKCGWYTVNVDIHKNKDIEFYCNICKQPIILEDRIEFIDLDLDIVRDKNNNWSIIDEDEFYENALLYNYPEDLKIKVFETKEYLLELIKNKNFPFDGFIDKQIDNFIREY